VRQETGRQDQHLRFPALASRCNAPALINLNSIIIMNDKNNSRHTFPYSTYYTTSTARNGNGFHASHGKPTDAPGQWILEPEAKLPPRAFDIHPRERARFHKTACAAPSDCHGLYEIERVGGEFFDATWGAEQAKFQHEIEQCQLEIDRLKKEIARLNAGLDVAPPPAVTGRPSAGFPTWFSLKWWAFILLLVLFGLSSAAALWNIGILYLPTAQSELIALLIATPWVLSAIGAKILTRSLRGRAATATKITVALAGLIGLVLWLTGMMPLAASLSVGDTGALLADRRLAFVGQLVCELASGFLFLTAMFEIIEHRSPTPVVEEVNEIHTRLAGVNRELQFTLSQMAKAKGNLLEWESSRAAFIQEGITIFHLRQGDATLVAELQRQRNANQKLLDEFIAKPVDPVPSSVPVKAATVLLAVACLSGFSATAAPTEPVKEIVIGLSPFQPAAQHESEQTLLRNYLLTGCPKGMHVVAVDGWNLTNIFDLQLPAFTFDSSAARAPKVLPALDALARWFHGCASNQPPIELKETAAIKVPQFIQKVSVSPESGRRAIVLLASPICVVPEEPTFSMSQKRYPSDGHLAHTRADSIYGIVGQGSSLTNSAIFWAYPSEAVWASAHHRDCVERWWSLYVAGQGGVLAGFGADAPQMLRAATNSNPRPIGNFAVDPGDSNVVMHIASNRVVVVTDNQPHPALLPAPQPTIVPPAPTPVKVVVPPKTRPTAQSALVTEPKPVAEPEQSVRQAQERAPSLQAPKEIPTPRIGNIGIAIFWEAARGADIDLRVAPQPGLPEAYWNRPSVERVHLFRDIRSSPSLRDNSQWQTAWEYCEVERAQLAEPVVWLNVYDANGPVTGIIRVQFDGRPVDRSFAFNVSRGNHGRDSNAAERGLSPFWQKVNLEEFFPTTASQPGLQSKNQ
jgi:hypothetical protein